MLGHPGLAIVLPAATDGATRMAGHGAVRGDGDRRRGQIVAGRASRLLGRPGPARPASCSLAEPDPARAIAALDARTLHIWLPAGAPPRGATGSRSRAGASGYLALQTEKEPFSRRKARHAVAAAIDPAAIGAAVEPRSVVAQLVPAAGRVGRRAGSPITLGAPDVARASSSAEAGLGRGASATLLVAADVEEQGRLAEALRAALDRAGMALRLQPAPATNVMALAQNGEHQMVLMEAEAEGGDPHILLYPLSTSEGATRGPSAWNLSFYRNARLDDLLIRASQLSFRPERQRVYARAQALLAEELPWIPLYVRRHWAVVRPEVTGLRLHPSGQHRLDRVSLDCPRARDRRMRVSSGSVQASPGLPERAHAIDRRHRHRDGPVGVPRARGRPGQIHGGRMMQWIATVGTMAAARVARGTVVLGAMDDIDFLHPVKVGELAVLRAQVEAVGRSSLEVGRARLTRRTSRRAAAR